MASQAMLGGIIANKGTGPGPTPTQCKTNHEPRLPIFQTCEGIVEEDKRPRTPLPAISSGALLFQMCNRRLLWRCGCDSKLLFLCYRRGTVLWSACRQGSVGIGPLEPERTLGLFLFLPPLTSAIPLFLISH